jgi:hypothetical protein
VSVPEANTEIGGERGKQALARLKQIVKRAQSPWSPATAEESFEIVRRRLFEEIPADKYRMRDAVLRSFSQMYQEDASSYPAEMRERDYERRMKAAYPIHPELFDRLYDDWSTLERFQRTRGVLRFMAKVIHELWQGGDDNLLILPSTVPLHAAPVQTEIMNNLAENWKPVIEKDVDGTTSLPIRIDGSNSVFGRYSAARRVARTVFIGSAPKLGTAKPGISDRRIRLGCVQPGESAATFGDALRQLSDQATHLYLDKSQYWYDTKPSINRTARDRTAQYLDERMHEVHGEIERRLRDDTRRRGPFAAVHVMPKSSSEVSDDAAVRLVVLGPKQPHVSGSQNSDATQAAGKILVERGQGQRANRNMLVFAAADGGRVAELEEAAAQFLAWTSIVEEAETLGLDPHAHRQAKTKREKASSTVNSRLRETYRWVLTPVQEDPKSAAIRWEASRLQSQDPLPQRAAKKLENEEQLLTVFSATRLDMAMENYGLWQSQDHIQLQTLWQHIAQYVYLPRLANPDLLLTAVQDGINQMTWTDHFAYAEAWDEEKGRYRALRAGEITGVMLDGLLVRPDVARRQIEAEREERAVTTASAAAEPAAGNLAGSGRDGAGGERARGDGERATGPTDAPEEEPNVTRFHGTVELDPLMMNRDAGQVSQEVVQHLVSLLDADVTVTLEIQAHVPGGIPDDVARIVSENANVLKFRQHDLEQD